LSNGQGRHCKSSLGLVLLVGPEGVEHPPGPVQVALGLAMVELSHQAEQRGERAAIEAATERELVEQDWLRRTEDFQEGIKAMADRRLPDFRGR
jgi:enoyl-CoA hydratase/carnithine racemase